MKQKQIEQKVLAVSIFVNTVIACAGFWVYTITNIQALFLDFFFSFIALLSSSSAIFISRISSRKTRHYPEGMYFLEPLYALLKSLLTLFLLIFSVMNTAKNAYLFFAQGIGSPLKTGPVLPYALLMVILCFILSFYNSYQNRKIHNVSTILAAEAKTNFVDGLQSLGVGLAIGLLYFIKIDSALGFLHFTGDFFITLILALISAKAPIKVLMTSFIELSGGILTSTTIKNDIVNRLDHYFNNPLDESAITIYKIGMKIKVSVAIDKIKDKTDLAQLPAIQKQAYHDISKVYENLDIRFRL